MNQRYFCTEFSMFSIQVILILGFLLYNLSWSWLSLELIGKVIAFSMLGLFNIASIVFMFIGLLSSERRDK